VSANGSTPKLAFFLALIRVDSRAAHEKSLFPFLPFVLTMLGDRRMNGEPKTVNPAAAGRISDGPRLARPPDVTQLLSGWSHGDHAALEKLAPLVYDELRRLAHHYMEGQRADHTLQTTALVNEAYLRLADQSRPNFTNRSHFLAVAAKAMRQILVNYAKASERQKRGAGASKVELDAAALVSPEPPGAILDLNEALERLAMLDSRKAQVVELRYFGGLKQDEIAEVLKVSVVTVRRDWVFARAWLYTELHNAADRHEFH
jgi:RNA polymerase sigma-70 factor, ECF subfamily